MKPKLSLQIRRDTSSAIDAGIAVAEIQKLILPENLTPIFAHRFTGKKSGHGLGLHSGALAAKQMGGSLSVASDGPDQGATFILELPVERESHTEAGTI